MPSRGHETVPKTAIPNVPSTMAELPIDPRSCRKKATRRADLRRDPRKPSRQVGLAPARGCRPGAIWRLSSASPAAPCAWPTNV